MAAPERLREGSRQAGVNAGPKNPETLEHVQLKTVRAVRHRIARALRGFLGVAAVGGAAGGAAGHYAEGRYHEWMGYSHEPPAQADAMEPDKAPEPEAASWMEKFGRELQKAKDAAIRKAEDVLEHNEQFRAYQEFKQKILDAGDKISFWLPFLMTFLSIVIITRKAMSAAHALRGGVDPLIRDDMETIEETLNDLIDQANRGILKAPEMATQFKRQVRGLNARFDGLTRTLQQEGVLPASLELE